MWFAYADNIANWHVIHIDQVKEIVAENKQRKRITSLEDFALEILAKPKQNFNNAMGKEILTGFDKPKPKKNNNKKRRPNKIVKKI